MEGKGGRSKPAMHYCGEQVLPRMLLHMVEAAAPIDISTHSGPGQQRLRRGVPDLAPLVLFHGKNRSLEHGAAGRSCREHPSIVRLAPTGGIESAAIQGNLPQRLPLRARNLADVGNMRIKDGDGWV